MLGTSYHIWFVQNVLNGIDERQQSLVSREQLENLLEVCQKVLDTAKCLDGQVIGKVKTFGDNLSKKEVIEILKKSRNNEKNSSIQPAVG